MMDNILNTHNIEVFVIQNRKLLIPQRNEINSSCSPLILYNLNFRPFKFVFLWIFSGSSGFSQGVQDFLKRCTCTFALCNLTSHEYTRMYLKVVIPTLKYIHISVVCPSYFQFINIFIFLEEYFVH